MDVDKNVTVFSSMDKDEEYIVNQKTGSLEESSIHSLIINFLWGHRLLSFILPTLMN